MQLTQRTLDRARQLLATLFITALSLLAIRRSLGSDVYPPEVQSCTLPLAGLALVWCWVDVVRDPGGRRAVRAFCWFSLLVALGHLALLPSFAGQATIPPLFYVPFAGMGVASAAFGTRVGKIGSVACGLLFGAIRWVGLDWINGVTSAAALAAVGLAVVELDRLAGVVTVDIQLSVDRSWRLQEFVARSRRRTFERQRWNGLIHDKILGALLIAVREPVLTENSRELASQALEALSPDVGPSHGSVSLAEHVMETAQRLSLEVTLQIEGPDPAPAVSDTLAAAVAEALTNVAKHSGQREASVRGRLSPASVTLYITDRGVGFRPDARPARRAGISLGIRDRLAAIGGTARIDSTPGLGTRVVLHWEGSGLRPETVTTWNHRLLQPLLQLMTVSMLLHCVSGWVLRGPVRHDTVVLAAALACLAVTVALVRLDPRSWARVPCIVLIVLAPVPLTLNLVDPVPLHWQYWWGGAFATALGVLGFRFRPWDGMLVLAGMIVAEALTQEFAFGSVSGDVLVFNYQIAVVSALLAAAVRRTLDDSATFIMRRSLEAGYSRIQLAEEQERERESARRRGELIERVQPLLERIVAGGELTEAERTTMARVEAETRDRLVAEAIVDDRVRAAAKSARDRGARVDLVAQAEHHSPEEGADLCSFREVLLACLEAVPASGQLTAQWNAGKQRKGTIAIAGAVSPEGLDRIRDAGASACGSLDVEVDADEDSVLVACARHDAGAALASG